MNNLQLKKLVQKMKLSYRDSNARSFLERMQRNSEWIRNMTKSKKGDRLVVEPKQEGLAVFSYNGLGFAARIGDNDIDTVFDVAKSAIKKQMERENEQQAREEVRPEESSEGNEPAESVDGDAPTGGVPDEVHGPRESDVR